MRISDLRHTVFIQTPTTSRNDRGAETISWTDSPRLRAKVATVSGDERQRDEQVMPLAGHQVTMRWPLPTGTTITTKSRLRWAVEGASRYFGIAAIGEPDNRRKLIVLTCEELIGEDRVI